MDNRRSNPALWKLTGHEETPGNELVDKVLEKYQGLSKIAPLRFPALSEISLNQSIAETGLRLVVRKRYSSGLSNFVADYLVDDRDKRKLTHRPVDACLFIQLGESLYAVTSGSAYRIFDDFIDYSFPFDTAKKLVANRFTASDVREINGPRAGRSEIYRRAQSISSSESFGKVWKRLVGYLNEDLLPDGSFLSTIIDPKKPPALEVKSSFTIRKRLALPQLTALARELESLPEPTSDQVRRLSFLDNLYVVRNGELVNKLRDQLIENLRQAVLAGTTADFDVDICDPDDAAAYQLGADYQVSRWSLDGDPPSIDDVLAVLRTNTTPDDPSNFKAKVESMRFRYLRDADDPSSEVRKELHKFMHGQVNLGEDTYFLLDKTWYRAQGRYLDNLKSDFLAEVFQEPEPILLGNDLAFLEWSHGDEDAYNKAQAGQPGYYYGDKIFARTDRGPVELFDLLYVDDSANKTYVIHAKDSFNAKMRDACSQISISRDIISRDILTGMETLKSYYLEWSIAPENIDAKITEKQFLAWFGREIIYVVLASTPTTFDPSSFEGGLNSHIARREIITTRNEFKGAGSNFRLAHTLRLK